MTDDHLLDDQMPFPTPDIVGNPEPRCPCLLLLDVSGSMSGEPITELNEGLKAFRDQYPKGRNYVVSPLNDPAYERVQDGLKIVVASPGELRHAMT